MRPFGFVVVVLVIACKEEKPPAPRPLPVSADAAVAIAPVPTPPPVPEPADAAPAPTPPAVTPPELPRGIETVEIPSREGALAVALLVDDARKFVEKIDDEVAVQKIEAKYVRSDGTLDLAYGELVVLFNVPAQTEVLDDPSRPLGAPVPEAKPSKPRLSNARCPRLVWKAGEWKSTPHFCVTKERIVGPRCSISTVWERAIVRGAPKDALAVLEIASADPRNNEPQRWHFRITDRPRKVNISFYVPDDCEMAVEK